MKTESQKSRTGGIDDYQNFKPKPKKKPLKQGIIIVCVELESVKVEEHN